MTCSENETSLARLLKERFSDVFDDFSEDEDLNSNLTEQECSTQSEAESFSSDDDNVPIVPFLPFQKTQNSDFFTGKNGTIWNKTPMTSSKSRSMHISREKMPEVSPAAASLMSPAECFTFFINDEFLNVIVENTNKFIAKVRSQYSRERDAPGTTLVEIKGLLGLILMCGVRKCNRFNVDDIYNKNGTSIEIARLVFSEHRCSFLLRCLRFDDKDTSVDRLKIDKLAPIRECFDIFVRNCKQGYSPSPFVTIGGIVSKFRGKCNFRQYIPDKNKKYGLKIHAAVDAKTFYVFNMEVDVGTQPNGPYESSGEPTDVVIRLCETISGSGRNVTTDSHYTDFQLTSTLLRDHNLTTVGVLRKNETQIPVCFSAIGRQPKSHLFGFQNDSTLLSYVPKRGKNVILLSSMHHDDKVDEISQKPVIVHDFYATESAVDTVDKLCNAYDCQRNTQRWPMVLFYTMLNIATINAQIIYETNNETTIIRRKFIEEVAFSLMEEQMRSRFYCQNISKTIRLRIQEILRIPEEAQQEGSPIQPQRVRGRCKYCDSRKNRKTKYSCFKCGKHMCLEHITAICTECASSGEVTELDY